MAARRKKGPKPTLLVETFHCAIIKRGRDRQTVDCYPTKTKARTAGKKAVEQAKKDDKRQACRRKCGD